MTTKNDNVMKVFLFYIFFMILFTLNLMIPISFFNVGSYTSRMWFLFELLVMLLSLYILVKEKLPNKKIIAVSLLFGVLAGLFNPIVGACTILSFLATASIFNKYGNRISVFKSYTRKQVCISISWGLAVGLILGTVNLFLSGSQSLDLDFKIIYLLYSLNPGIFEEISFRMFLYAFSVYLLKGEIDSAKKKIWCYILMVIPHVLIHTPDLLLENGVFNFLIYLLILSLLFGLPFALLQKKRDLTSAMVAHGLVDFIRFCFVGLPM